jgi:trehalose synthase-fused probable maltokinase
MVDSAELAAWIGAQRWFAAKDRRIARVQVEDRVGVGRVVLLVVRVRLDDTSEDRYAIPLAPGGEIVDALDGDHYSAALFALIGDGGRLPGEHGGIVGRPTRAFPVGDRPVGARRLAGEQSNTSVILGEVAILKHFRRLAAGPNPEQEITGFLTERTAFRHAPRLYGHVDYLDASGEVAALAVAHEVVRGADDGWAWIVGQLRELFARGPGHPEDREGLVALASGPLGALERLGEHTAALHAALASVTEDPAFAPEPITPADAERWADGVRRQIATAAAAAPTRDIPAAPDVRGALAALVGRAKIRHHGDFHLGQTLYRPGAGAWVLLDFEGEPLRPLAERRRKASPLRDVAGMLRSIDYAGVTAAADPADPRAASWRDVASAAFVRGYRRVARAAAFVPRTDAAFDRAVAAFVVEKAAYEVVYEASHRPEWIGIPVEGLRLAVRALAA